MAVDFEHPSNKAPNSHLISGHSSEKNEAIDREKKWKDDRRLLCILIFIFVAGQIQ